MATYEELKNESLAQIAAAEQEEDYVVKEFKVEVAKVNALLALAAAIQPAGNVFNIKNQMAARRKT